MNQKKPKNLNLLTMHFPVPAIVSILHRISGVILFLLIPLLLWALNQSLTSEQNYNDLLQSMQQPLIKFIVWCALSAFIYHFIAGVRHLLMDVHIGEKLNTGRLGAVLTMVISIVLIILVGIWLW